MAEEFAAVAGAHWVFGYGSLIYKVDFPYLRREVAAVTGWERRFWQGSHDHRGTAEAPGRVVTLVASPGAVCKGMAYLIDESVFAHLDHREKNGYRRHEVEISLAGRDHSVAGVLYVADEGNHAFLGPAPAAEIAAHIVAASGPSGSNRDYLLQLAHALRDIDAADPHVHELALLVRQMTGPGP